ncbi:MAG: adenylate kinase [Erysipelothrix sp.]|nr:adenylate kinase [Erysipelothrix sp.]
MNLLIMGPAGSGKGTMSAKIVDLYQITHISTGDMFREAISKQTPVGVEAKSFIDQGLLVPDDVTNRMVEERISQDDCLDGYLLDGFPRSMSQALFIEKTAKDMNRPIECVINLEIDHDILVRRITGRRLCKTCGEIYHIDTKPSKVEGVCDVCGGELYQRSDDNEEGLRVRLNEYTNQTQAAIEFFREKGLVQDVNADQVPDNVIKDIEIILEALK